MDSFKVYPGLGRQSNIFLAPTIKILFNFCLSVWRDALLPPLSWFSSRHPAKLLDLNSCIKLGFIIIGILALSLSFSLYLSILLSLPNALIQAGSISLAPTDTPSLSLLLLTTHSHSFSLYHIPHFQSFAYTPFLSLLLSRSFTLTHTLSHFF